MSNKHLDTNRSDDVRGIPSSGRILALDPGSKRVGVAISDELRLAVRPLKFIERGSWKSLLATVVELIRVFDAKVLVLGLPLRMDGSEGEAAAEVRRILRNFSASLDIAVALQDERLTSQASVAKLKSEGKSEREIADLVDSQAAAIILEDFISGLGS